MPTDTLQIPVLLPNEPYSIFVGPGLLDVTSLARHLNGLLPDRIGTCAIVTNTQVGRLYAARLADSLRTLRLEPRIVEIPEGEGFKTLDTVQQVYDQLVDAGLDRNSIVFALGGGVVGDLAGFVAATFLRGVPFVQVPTSLLAMVDASIGGKVAVDHPQGKNLIGAFKQPRVVIADTDTLKSLPHAEWRAGMAEVIKHGLIGDPGLLDVLGTGYWKQDVGLWLPRALQVKVNIVVRDPLERGERARLNLGHTFAHAFEEASGFQMRHGDAVSIGLVCATHLAVRKGICQPALEVQVEDLLRRLELPTRIPQGFAPERILTAMLTDKKRRGARLHFVLPRGPGDVIVTDDVDQNDVLAVLSGMLQ